MFFTLDRMEDGNIAVLLTDDGKKYDVEASALPAHDGVGSVFLYENGSYRYLKEETGLRRSRIAEKYKQFFSKHKKN